MDKLDDVSQARVDRQVRLALSCGEKDRRIQALEAESVRRRNLEQAAIEYVRAVIMGETRSVTAGQAEVDLISEVSSYLVEVGEWKPDPADDPALVDRLHR